jgi:chondroitin AC lyase
MVGRDKAALANSDSAWADVNYSNDNSVHLGRVENFAKAYSSPKSKYYGDAGMYEAIARTLEYWYSRNPVNKNWWHNDISYPQHIGEILIMMRYGKKPLPQATENKLIERMIRRLKPKDGANTSDEALHFLYRACLTQNKATMDSAVFYLFEPVAIAKEGEGVQVDNSYFQHGSQQAIASYGKVFIANSWNAAFYLRGTPYAMPPNQLAILSSFYKNTFLQTIRGSFYDFNVRGRGLSRKDSLQSGMKGLLQKVKLVDMAEEGSWDAAEKRTGRLQPPAYGIMPAHTHYWKSNYTNHLRPAYSFSVQASSVRTLRTERGNNENIYGKFLPDGATNIQRRGAEYANIMPVWKWDKIPGVTNRHYNNDEGTMIHKEWGIAGATAFAGGVSDSLYGASAYDLDFDSVTAKKAWFFFDKEVVCLGAGIRSKATEAITTTINQCWLNGNILTSAGTMDKGNTSTYNNLTWVLHDSIGYFFPKGGDIGISGNTQSGSWYRINNFQPTEEVSGNVFALWMNHGAQPANGSYAYIVVPGMTGKAAMSSYPVADIRILSNSDSIQAVQHTGLDILQVVFYKAGTLTSPSLSIAVDKPCIIYIKNTRASKPLLYIADPAQQQSRVMVTVKQGAKSKQLVCDLPQGSYAGATTVSTIDNQ